MDTAAPKVPMRDPKLASAEHWDVRELIGKGAFAEVFLALPRGQGSKNAKPCVLKRVKLARQTAWQREATLREIKLMGQLDHPFIVPHIASWTHHGHTVNVVLGYCEHGDLSSVLAKRKGKPFEEVVLRRWLAQLLLALDYLEGQAVLHRDIKTGNIFLCAEGHVQLGDFGLASVRDARDAASSHDQSLVGTPHFMSPELLGQKGYDHQTDVWSLGCVMYELTAGRPAFTAFNLKGLIQKICRSPVPPLPGGYSEDWNALIKSMLRKDPVQRPTVRQLLAVPSMASAVAEGRRLARNMSPGVVLPPMPDAPFSLARASVSLASETSSAAQVHLPEGALHGHQHAVEEQEEEEDEHGTASQLAAMAKAALGGKVLHRGKAAGEDLPMPDISSEGASDGAVLVDAVSSQSTPAHSAAGRRSFDERASPQQEALPAQGAAHMLVAMGPAESAADSPLSREPRASSFSAAGALTSVEDGPPGTPCSVRRTAILEGLRAVNTPVPAAAQGEQQREERVQVLVREEDQLPPSSPMAGAAALLPVFVVHGTDHHFQDAPTPTLLLPTPPSQNTAASPRSARSTVSASGSVQMGSPRMPRGGAHAVGDGGARAPIRSSAAGVAAGLAASGRAPAPASSDVSSGVSAASSHAAGHADAHPQQQQHQTPGAANSSTRAQPKSGAGASDATSAGSTPAAPPSSKVVKSSGGGGLGTITKSKPADKEAGPDKAGAATPGAGAAASAPKRPALRLGAVAGLPAEAPRPHSARAAGSNHARILAAPGQGAGGPMHRSSSQSGASTPAQAQAATPAGSSGADAGTGGSDGGMAGPRVPASAGAAAGPRAPAAAGARVPALRRSSMPVGGAAAGGNAVRALSARGAGAGNKEGYAAAAAARAAGTGGAGASAGAAAFAQAPLTAPSTVPYRRSTAPAARQEGGDAALQAVPLEPRPYSTDGSASGSDAAGLHAGLQGPPIDQQPHTPAHAHRTETLMPHSLLAKGQGRAAAAAAAHLGRAHPAPGGAGTTAAAAGATANGHAAAPKALPPWRGPGSKTSGGGAAAGGAAAPSIAATFRQLRSAISSKVQHQMHGGVAGALHSKGMGHGGKASRAGSVRSSRETLHSHTSSEHADGAAAGAAGSDPAALEAAGSNASHSSGEGRPGAASTRSSSPLSSIEQEQELQEQESRSEHSHSQQSSRGSQEVGVEHVGSDDTQGEEAHATVELHSGRLEAKIQGQDQEVVAEGGKGPDPCPQGSGKHEEEQQQEPEAMEVDDQALPVVAPVTAVTTSSQQQQQAAAASTPSSPALPGRASGVFGSPQAVSLGGASGDREPSLGASGVPPEPTSTAAGSPEDREGAGALGLQRADSTPLPSPGPIAAAAVGPGPASAPAGSTSPLLVTPMAASMLFPSPRATVDSDILSLPRSSTGGMLPYFYGPHSVGDGAAAQGRGRSGGPRATDEEGDGEGAVLPLSGLLGGSSGPDEGVGLGVSSGSADGEHLGGVVVTGEMGGLTGASAALLHDLRLYGNAMYALPTRRTTFDHLTDNMTDDAYCSPRTTLSFGDGATPDGTPGATPAAGWVSATAVAATAAAAAAALQGVAAVGVEGSATSIGIGSEDDGSEGAAAVVPVVPEQQGQEGTAGSGAASAAICPTGQGDQRRRSRLAGESNGENNSAGLGLGQGIALAPIAVTPKATAAPGARGAAVQGAQEVGEEQGPTDMDVDCGHILTPLGEPLPSPSAICIARASAAAGTGAEAAFAAATASGSAVCSGPTFGVASGGLAAPARGSPSAGSSSRGSSPGAPAGLGVRPGSARGSPLARAWGGSMDAMQAGSTGARGSSRAAVSPTAAAAAAAAAALVSGDASAEGESSDGSGSGSGGFSLGSQGVPSGHGGVNSPLTMHGTRSPQTPTRQALQQPLSPVHQAALASRRLELLERVVEEGLVLLEAGRTADLLLLLRAAQRPCSHRSSGHWSAGTNALANGSSLGSAAAAAMFAAGSGSGLGSSPGLPPRGAGGSSLGATAGGGAQGVRRGGDGTPRAQLPTGSMAGVAGGQLVVAGAGAVRGDGTPRGSSLSRGGTPRASNGA